MSIIDAAAWVGSAGAVCAIIVQLVKVFAGVDEPRWKVITALVASTILVVSYALSNALLTLPNTYGLIVAAVTIAATGAGVQTAVTAARTNAPQ